MNILIICICILGLWGLWKFIKYCIRRDTELRQEATVPDKESARTVCTALAIPDEQAAGISLFNFVQEDKAATKKTSMKFFAILGCFAILMIVVTINSLLRYDDSKQGAILKIEQQLVPREQVLGDLPKQIEARKKELKKLDEEILKEKNKLDDNIRLSNLAKKLK